MANLLSKIEYERCAWIGSEREMPDRGMIAVDSVLDHKNAWRASSELHQSFDRVVLRTSNLSALKHWRIVVDESMRLVRPGGFFDITFQESNLLSIFELKNFIFTWANEKVSVVAESKSGNFTNSVFRMTHDSPRNTDATLWTFGILSDGKRTENVVAFIDSIKSISGLTNFEIIVCGPQLDQDFGSNVKFLTPPVEFDEIGWITRKKNLIVEEASRPNILICHDRYVLPTDFLEKIAEFGGDFDLVSPRQVMPDGSRFPDWVCTGAEWNWTPSGLLQYDDYSPFNYVNGGLIISKTAHLKRIGWNELLFWGQAEDVEFSRRMARNGITNRPYEALEVVSLEARPDYKDDFFKLPNLPKHYVLPFRAGLLPYKLFDGASISSVGSTPHILTLLIKLLVKSCAPSIIGKTGIEALMPKLIRVKKFLQKVSPRLTSWLEVQIREVLGR